MWKLTGKCLKPVRSKWEHRTGEFNRPSFELKIGLEYANLSNVRMISIGMGWRRLMSHYDSLCKYSTEEVPERQHMKIEKRTGLQKVLGTAHNPVFWCGWEYRNPGTPSLPLTWGVAASGDGFPVIPRSEVLAEYMSCPSTTRTTRQVKNELAFPNHPTSDRGLAAPAHSSATCMAPNFLTTALYTLGLATRYLAKQKMDGLGPWGWGLWTSGSLASFPSRSRKVAKNMGTEWNRL